MNVLSEYKNPSVSVVSEQDAWFPSLSVRPHKTLQARCLEIEQQTHTSLQYQASLVMFTFIIYQVCIFLALHVHCDQMLLVSQGCSMKLCLAVDCM